MSETDTGITFKDNFIELLMLEETGNWYHASPSLENLEKRLAENDPGTSLI